MRRNPAPARLTDSAPLVALSRSPPRGGKWTFDKIQGECCHNLLATLDRRSDLTDRSVLRVPLCFRSQPGVLWNNRVLIYLRHLLHGPTGRPYFFPVLFPSSRRNPIARGPRVDSLLLLERTPLRTDEFCFPKSPITRQLERNETR